MDQYNQNYPDYTPPPYDAPPPKSNRTLIIIVVVILVLCCCCVVGGLLSYFVIGDIFTDALGITRRLLSLPAGI